jgi:hypothetical protein
MPTFGDTPVPEDIVRKDITNEQVAFLKRNFSQEASNEGLVASFQETSQPDGLMTLIIHFARQDDARASLPGGQAAAPPAGRAATASPGRDSVAGAAPASPAAGSVTGALAWGAKVSAAFRDKVRAIASGLGTDPNLLMAAMAFETGCSFNASQLNKAGSGAVGMIQFMPKTATALGTTSAALAAMTAEDQLDFVQKYFEPYKGKLHSLADLYMAILWPVAVPKPDDFVLFSMNINPKVYAQNKGLDVNDDGKVTKSEAASKIQAMLTEGLKTGNVG